LLGMNMKSPLETCSVYCLHYKRVVKLGGICCILLVITTSTVQPEWNPTKVFDSPLPLEREYGFFRETDRLEMLEETKKMFYHGYDNYMLHAFPLDELNPLACCGRGPDTEDPSNININDVLGDYSLGLIDALDMLVVMGNSSELRKAVRLVVDTVHFDKDNVVQVFEANIRVLGGLLSTHLLLSDSSPLGPADIDGLSHDSWYMDDLLTLAHDLGDRLLAAFDQTDTGLPLPRVNLKSGLPNDGRTTTCTAGAGSLLLEFTLLSRLLGDPTYELYARRAVLGLYNRRNLTTGLLGNVIDVHTGEWKGRMAGLGAGVDSFYEILLKSFVMFGEVGDLEMFNESYDSIMQYMRRGRDRCNSGSGLHPLYVNVEMETGNTATNWIDSLQAAFPGVQVLHGDIEEAICHHALYFGIWRKYGCLPERYNWRLDAPDVKFYPLRPEFVESTYLLYRATKNPFYLHVGREIVESLNKHTKAKCGYATVHDVNDMSLEDRQESFFLSETVKYLYLLFDTENTVNKHDANILFTTEGHILPIDVKFRSKPWEKDGLFDEDLFSLPSIMRPNSSESPPSMSPHSSCDTLSDETRFSLPLRNRYLQQIFSVFGL